MKREMVLENLRNELWFAIFEYLLMEDRLHALNQLNSRFRTLLVDCQSSSLHIPTTSRSHLNTLHDHYLPSIVQRIVSLCLSDREDCPQHIYLLSRRNFTLDRFVR